MVSVFVDYDPRALKSFAPSKQAGKYLADIYGLAKDRLHAVGINDIDGGDNCTYENMNFFSYRRDHITGRMASFIWIKT